MVCLRYLFRTQRQICIQYQKAPNTMHDPSRVRAGKGLSDASSPSNRRPMGLKIRRSSTRWRDRSGGGSFPLFPPPPSLQSGSSRIDPTDLSNCRFTFFFVCVGIKSRRGPSVFDRLGRPLDRSIGVLRLRLRRLTPLWHTRHIHVPQASPPRLQRAPHNQPGTRGHG